MAFDEICANCGHLFWACHALQTEPPDGHCPGYVYLDPTVKARNEKIAEVVAIVTAWERLCHTIDDPQAYREWATAYVDGQAGKG